MSTLSGHAGTLRMGHRIDPTVSPRIQYKPLGKPPPMPGWN